MCRIVYLSGICKESITPALLLLPPPPPPPRLPPRRRRPPPLRRPPLQHAHTPLLRASSARPSPRASAAARPPAAAPPSPLVVRHADDDEGSGSGGGRQTICAMPPPRPDHQQHGRLQPNHHDERSGVPRGQCRLLYTRLHMYMYLCRHHPPGHRARDSKPRSADKHSSCTAGAWAGATRHCRGRLVPSRHAAPPPARGSPLHRHRCRRRVRRPRQGWRGPTSRPLHSFSEMLRLLSLSPLSPPYSGGSVRPPPQLRPRRRRRRRRGRRR